MHGKVIKFWEIRNNQFLVPMKFRDAHQEEQFSEKGFVSFPLLNEAEVQELYELYNWLKLEDPHAIYTNIQDRSREDNKVIENKIFEVVGNKLDSILENHYIDGGTFLIKGTGEKSSSTMHQDWRVVDEDRYRSMSIWIPLIDVDENNGCLQVVPGSHKWESTIRSMNIPSLYVDFEDIEDHLVSIPLKAGHAAAHHHSLFHGSKPNYTNQIRPAVVLGIISADTDSIHYLANENGEIDIVRADEEFYHKAVKAMYERRKPDLEVLQTIPFKDTYTLTEERFMSFLKSKETKKGFSFFRFLGFGN